MSSTFWHFLAVSAVILSSLLPNEKCVSALRAGPLNAPLPAGVKAVWDMEKASREKTPTRERVYLNGLWRWQPGATSQTTVTAGQWGFFKVPGFWPGNNNYIQEDCQTLYPHPDWKNT